jgi:hypothetical protein
MTQENDASKRERLAWAEFALACRRERDRIAAAELEAEDRRFEASTAERALAEALVARLIAAVAS